MQFYADVRAFTMLGETALVATVRSDTQEGATEPVLVLSTHVLDDGDDDPREFLHGALVGLLEVL